MCTLQTADLIKVEGRTCWSDKLSRRALPWESSEEERAEHEDDNDVDEDRGVGARCLTGAQIHRMGLTFH